MTTTPYPPAATATPAIVILGAASLTVARRIQSALPAAQIYGLAHRIATSDLSPEFSEEGSPKNDPDLAPIRPYENFGDLVRELFQAGRPIVGICAAGILIRTIAPLLVNKWQEPPVLAIAEDGSAVVPLLGGTQGASRLAHTVAGALGVAAAVTATGDLRFRTALLSPPDGYRLINPEDAKTFISDLLAGATVELVGSAPWLAASRIPFQSSPPGCETPNPGPDLTIQVVQKPFEVAEMGRSPASNYLVYEFDPAQDKEATCHLAIVGTGPGGVDWMSPEVKQALQAATDWVGYKTYLDLVEPLRQPHTRRHESDNRVELDRARAALDLAASGRSVAIVSSGDPGIYAMAAAVFEVLEREANPVWARVKLRVCPGISAMQAAAAQVGAPLGHDFCAISLSDLLKPWEVIAQRIAAAAEADFAIAFYNPVSQQRRWQLDQAKQILLQWRSPQTPIVLAQNLGRPGQQVTVQALEQLAVEQVDMRTVILIGSSQTRAFNQNPTTQWVYTPRHY